VTNKYVKISDVMDILKDETKSAFMGEYAQGLSDGVAAVRAYLQALPDITEKGIPVARENGTLTEDTERTARAQLLAVRAAIPGILLGLDLLRAGAGDALPKPDPEAIAGIAEILGSFTP